MATVILARHGRTAANASGVLAGRSKGVHLDDTGTGQARDAAERLADLELAAVVTSPLERCRETAKILAPGHRVVTDRRLLECDYGEWTGQELKQLAKEKLWRTVQAQPSGARFPGGESLPEMSARAVNAIRDRDAAVQAETGDHAVWLAVSHGDVLTAILADALGMHLDAFQRIMVDPASLSVVRYTPHRAFVLTMNSRCGSLRHLASKPSRRRSRSSDAVVGGGSGPSDAPVSGKP
ncbi:MAG: family putative phosphomutase [Marmoricola sp.]|nr:family putative phosphomutase [Marmoricola sp.]